MDRFRDPSDLERDFVKKWQRESGKLVNLDVMSTAAEILDLQGDGLHVDIASGNGAMLSALREEYPHLTLVGIERYASLLALAARNFKESNLPFHIVDNDARISHSYPMIADIETVKKKSVFLVRDHIKELLVLKRLLKGEMVDSASFMLTGISKASVAESHNVTDELGYSKEEAIKLMGGVRQAVCRNVSELVKTGGKFVMVQKAGSEAMSGDVTQQIMSKMHGYDRYWDPVDRHELVGLDIYEEDVTTGITWVSTLDEKEMSEEESLVLLIQSFIRNSLPFDSDPEESDPSNSERARSVIHG